MTRSEQNRVVAWRLRIIREASELPRGVAQTCRHFGLSRKTFYKWRARYKSHGDASLCARPRAPLQFPRATPRNVVSKISIGDDIHLFNDKLREWEDYYNYHRPHGALDGQTPYERLLARKPSARVLPKS